MIYAVLVVIVMIMGAALYFIGRSSGQTMERGENAEARANETKRREEIMSKPARSRDDILKWMRRKKD